MELQLQRKSDDGQGTLGALTLVHNAVRAPNTGYRMSNLVTLEDTFNRVKIVHESRIPAGRYRILHRAGGDMHTKYQRRFADAHEGMFWLQEVPGFSWIYIHIGNSPEDTSGCILVGLSTTSGHTIARSADAYRILAKTINTAFARGEEVWITIKDEVTRVETSPFPPDMGHPYVDRGKLPAVSAMIRRVDGLEGVVERHDQWIEMTDVQLERIERESTMRDQSVARLQRAENTSKGQIGTLINDYKALADEVTELDDRVEELERDDLGTNKHIDSLCKAITIDSKRIDALTTADNERNIRELDDNKDLHARLDNQRQYLDTCNSRLSQHDSDLEKAVTRIDSLDQRSNTLVNRSTDHHEELETQRAEINDLKETVAALTTAFPIDAIITRLKKLEAK